jgi:hypothetical protein
MLGSVLIIDTVGKHRILSVLQFVVKLCCFIGMEQQYGGWWWLKIKTQVLRHNTDVSEVPGFSKLSVTTYQSWRRDASEGFYPHYNFWKWHNFHCDVMHYLDMFVVCLFPWASAASYGRTAACWLIVPPALDVPTSATRCPRAYWRVPHSSGGSLNLWAGDRTGKFHDFHGTFRFLLHAANLRHGTHGLTPLPKEGVLSIFPPLKIRRLRLGLKPWTWVPEASTLTSIPPKPLSRHVRMRYFFDSENPFSYSSYLSTQLFTISFSGMPVWCKICSISTGFTTNVHKRHIMCSTRQTHHS